MSDRSKGNPDPFWIRTKNLHEACDLDQSQFAEGEPGVCTGAGGAVGSCSGVGEGVGVAETISGFTGTGVPGGR